MKCVENSAVASAKNWILNSGIQIADGPNIGGFNSWFDMKENSYSYVYSEITGYGITTLLHLGNYFDDAEYLDKAALAADWLIAKAGHPCGGVRTRDYYKESGGSRHYSFKRGNIYAFDNGMVLYGMINLYKRTKDMKHLEFAGQIADFLIKNMVKPDGLLWAVFDTETGKKTDESDKWSTQSGSYHAKLAMAFTDLFEVTGDAIYKETALNLCGASLSFQEASGRFITSRSEGSTHLHPHSYSAEGLLYAGAYFDKEEFIESAERAVKWALDSQMPDGGLPKKYDGKEFIPFYRSDILAQMLRLGTILRDEGRLGPGYDPVLEKLKDKLVSFQYSGEGDQSGGFFYGTDLEGTTRQHINSWCTMFALQALIMYDEFSTNDKITYKLDCLI